MKQPAYNYSGFSTTRIERGAARAEAMATFNHIVRVPLNGTTMTINVRPVYTREFFVRMWLGMQLLKMAAWVLGCNFVFDRGDEEDTHVA